MFRCQVTGELSAPKEPQIRVVVEERPVTYTNYHLNEQERYVEFHSSGREIVKELTVTKAGLAYLENNAIPHRRV